MTTFLFGMASPDNIPRLVEDAEDLYGLEVLQIVLSTMQLPQSPLAPPGSRPAVAEVARLIVRLPKADYPAFVKKVEENQAKVQVVKGPGIQ